jgi:hypothetical protein
MYRRCANGRLEIFSKTVDVNKLHKFNLVPALNTSTRMGDSRTPMTKFAPSGRTNGFSKEGWCTSSKWPLPRSKTGVCGFLSFVKAYPILDLAILFIGRRRYRRHASPLRDVPGPFITSLTRLWKLRQNAEGIWRRLTSFFIGNMVYWFTDGGNSRTDCANRAERGQSR